MSRGSRVAVAVTGALAALYVAAGLVAPAVFEADRFRHRVEARISDALGRPVRLGRIRLSVWTGIAVRAERLDVGTSPDAEAVAASLERVSVRLAAWPLLGGSLRVRSVAVGGGAFRSGRGVLVSGIRGRARLDSAPGGAPRIRGLFRGALESLDGDPFEARFEATVLSDGFDLGSVDLSAGPARLRAEGEVRGAGADGFRVALRGAAALKVSRAEGTFEWRAAPGGPSVSFRVTSPMMDFDEVARFAGGRPAPSERASSGGRPGMAWAATLPVRGTALRGIRGGGTIEAARARFRGIDVTDLAVTVALDRGRVRFDDAVFGLYGGRHRGSLSIELEAEGAPYALESRVEGVDASRLLAAVLPARGGALHGVAALDLKVAGGGPSSPPSRAVRGRARAELRNGRLASVGILKQVAELLEMAGGRGLGRDETPFDHLSASFEVREGAASTRDLEFRSADLDLDGGGSVGLDGSLRLDLLASFSGAASADLIRNTPRLKFRVDDGGRLTLPLQIRGSLEAPAVRLDLDRVLKEGLERSVRTDRKARGLLDRLFGGD